MAKLNSSVHYLAGYEILAGIAGLVMTSFYAFQLPQIILSLKVVLCIVLVMYLHLVISGLLILLKDEKLGLIHSAVNQGLQIVHIALFGFAFQYYAGPALKFTWHLNESFWPYLSLGFSSWEIVIGMDEVVKYIGLNIVALVLFILIFRKIKKIESDNLSKDVGEIGKV
jgi:hypothetical protein